MSTRKIGIALAALGAFGVFVSVIVDYIGFGKGGIQAAQILGILAGLFLAAVGLSVAFQVPEGQVDIGGSFKGGARRLLDMPVSAWFVIGFLIVYVLFFLSPVFFNADRRMAYFNRFIPDRYPIGADMSYTLSYVKTWVTTGVSPYPKSHYPPLTYVLLSPLTLLGYPEVYFVSTYLTLFSYVVLTLLLPILFNSKKDFSLILLLSVTGLFSYGFQFELERAQYYTMAFLLCMLAIYLFHHHEVFRFLAYLLFSVSVHLKIVPIFFLPMFVKDWRDWKGNVKRMLGLGLLNVALLFVLGFRNFLNFLDALLLRVENPTFLWNGNHSVGNFVFNFVQDGYGILSEKTILFLQKNEKPFEMILLVIIVLCVLAVLFHLYRSGQIGFSPTLLLVCTLCALSVPVSVDYTLPMLVAPMAIFLGGMPGLGGSSGSKVVSILLVLVASISYASLLYPFKYKPYFLNNSFPPLFLLLIAVTLLYFLQGQYRAGNNLDQESGY